MIRTQIYLPQNQLLQLKQIAFKEDISVSEVLRKIIDERFSRKDINTKTVKKKYKNVGTWLLSQARMAEKLGWKGPKDLARNMDEYLYGGKK